ncbi:MAG: hypothetical protein ACR2FF_08270 [Mycobacteriales bacterium]
MVSTTRDVEYGRGVGRYSTLLTDSGRAAQGGAYVGLTATTDAQRTKAG